MRRIAPLLPLILLCVMASTAHAWTRPPADDGARLARFLPIARAAWPASPCAGREVVHLGAAGPLAAEAPRVTGSERAMLDGMAGPATCEVWMSGNLSALTFCTVLVHEFGHLAGHGHSPAPGDVMNGEGDVSYRPCERDVTPPPLGRMLDEVRSLLPAPRAEWRISCGARRAGERRCVARRGTRVRSFFVSRTRRSLIVAAAG
jgi:hypothetical protein